MYCGSSAGTLHQWGSEWRLSKRRLHLAASNPPVTLTRILSRLPGRMSNGSPRSSAVALVNQLTNDVRRTADVSVIFPSVCVQADTVARSLAMGAADYLVSPFSSTELAAWIRVARCNRQELCTDQAQTANRRRRAMVVYALTGTTASVNEASRPYRSVRQATSHRPPLFGVGLLVVCAAAVHQASRCYRYRDGAALRTAVIRQTSSLNPERSSGAYAVPTLPAMRWQRTS